MAITSGNLCHGPQVASCVDSVMGHFGPLPPSSNVPESTLVGTPGGRIRCGTAEFYRTANPRIVTGQLFAREEMWSNPHRLPTSSF